MWSTCRSYAFVEGTHPVIDNAHVLSSFGGQSVRELASHADGFARPGDDRRLPSRLSPTKHHQSKNQWKINDRGEEQATSRRVRSAKGQTGSVVEKARAQDKNRDEVNRPGPLRHGRNEAGGYEGERKHDGLPRHEVPLPRPNR